MIYYTAAFELYKNELQTDMWSGNYLDWFCDKFIRDKYYLTRKLCYRKDDRAMRAI